MYLILVLDRASQLTWSLPPSSCRFLIYLYRFVKDPKRPPSHPVPNAGPCSQYRLNPVRSSDYVRRPRVPAPGFEEVSVVSGIFE